LFQVGLAIKPMTPVERVLPYVELVDLILIMTVEPGFGGQTFMYDMMPKVSKLVVHPPTSLLLLLLVYVYDMTPKVGW